MINIVKKNFPIKSRNLENGLDKFYFSNLLASATLSCLKREAWNWPISCLNYSETQERGLWEIKSRKLLGGASFWKFLEALAFSAHLGNWSIFILDPLLIIPYHKTLFIHQFFTSQTNCIGQT